MIRLLIKFSYYFVLLLIAACVGLSPIDIDFSKKVYASTIEEEFQGDECYVEGETWQQYWTGVILALRANIPEEQAEELEGFIVQERRLRELPELECL